ncbi:MAG: H-type lectin domain-containing protein [Paracoccus sp. (in: a-proteobacteria)]|nr:H-type lectin domain-containing protein [Paracoccus sp. (in: a-proteobacteria)]MDO5621357.1 H-type lectin domain-containing protein [Paracoccus sp. (in: a-proteobacteria)]
MLRFSHHAIGVQQGRQILFSDFENDGPMWTGNGPRHVRVHVLFPQPFLATPAVQLSMSMWDSAGDSNQRGDLSAENISAEGFDIIFRTWGDSRMARVRADWTAIGAVPHLDQWDV